MRRGGKESGWLASRAPNSNKTPEAKKTEQPKASSRRYLGQDVSGLVDETSKTLRKKLIRKRQCILTTFPVRSELRSEPMGLAAWCLWPTKKQAQQTSRRIWNEAKRLFSFKNGNILMATRSRLSYRNGPNENKPGKRQGGYWLQCV